VVNIPFPGAKEARMETQQEIRDFILKALLQGSQADLEEETPLIADGYLTSLQTVELVAFLEQRFQVEIEPEEVTEENFQTISAVARLVDGKREGHS
jgi:acyl carrier protein